MTDQITQVIALSFPSADATYDLRDNTLRIYFSSRLDKAEYQHIKGLGFQLAPEQGFFILFGHRDVRILFYLFVMKLMMRKLVRY